VAAYAASLDLVVIDFGNRAEGRGGMAAFALIRRPGMSCRHWRRGHEAAAFMAVRTAFGRALEDPPHMAAFTRGAGMCSGEGKPGLKMIEIQTARLCVRFRKRC